LAIKTDFASRLATPALFIYLSHSLIRPRLAFIIPILACAT
jgi:hypothetical protein